MDDSAESVGRGRVQTQVVVYRELVDLICTTDACSQVAIDRIANETRDAILEYRDLWTGPPDLLARFLDKIEDVIRTMYTARERASAAVGIETICNVCNTALRSTV
jgi:hypothetical protein